MALLGGGVGGAGNPVGGSFTGASLALEYILDHCYAYSGTVLAAASNQTLMEFTTGNKLIVGSLTCAGAIPNNGSGIASGAVSVFTLSLNGGEVARFKTSTSGTSPDNEAHQTYPIMIPPYTEVKLIGLSSATDGYTSAILTGKTYQTRD